MCRLKQHGLLTLVVIYFILMGMISMGCATTSTTSTRTTEPASTTRTTSTLTTSPVAAQPQSSLDLAMGSLTEQIATNFSKNERVKIAVFNFVDLQGNTNQLGMFIAEELITRLFQSGQFEVVERRLLDKVLEEQKLTMSGLVETESVQKLGSILGVKAIVTGTVTDLESVVKINARIIAADTGRLSAAAGVSLSKDSDVRQLMTSTSAPSKANDVLNENKPAPTPALPPKTFFLEDFSTVPKGLIPAGWLGGETFVVNDSKKLKGKKELKTVSVGPHSFMIRNIRFPRNWTWEIEMTSHTSHDDLVLEIGGLSVQFDRSYRWGALQGSKFEYVFSGEVTLLAIEKRDSVFRLLIDGKEYALVRVPGFKEPSTFRFSDRRNRQTTCSIYRIEGKTLQ